MSLRPDDRSGRGRSASTSGRDRDRSRSNVRAPEPPQPPGVSRHSSYGYPAAQPSSVMPGSFDDTPPTYEVRAPPAASASSNRDRDRDHDRDRNSYYAPPGAGNGAMVPYPDRDRDRDRDQRGYGAENGRSGYGDYSQRDGYDQRGGNGYHPPPPPLGRSARRDEADLAYGDSDSDSDDHRYSSRKEERRPQYDERRPQRQDDYRSQQQQPQRRDDYRPSHDDDPYRPRDQLSRQSSTSQRYTPGSAPDPRYEKGQYTTAPTGPPPLNGGRPSARDEYGRPRPDERSTSYTSNGNGQDPYGHARTYPHSAGYDPNAQVMEITPGGAPPRGQLERHNSTSSARGHRLSSAALQPPGAIGGLAPQMGLLSVGGAMGAAGAHAMGGGLPPPSPLLEAYRGTYQSISPMPLALRPDDDDEMSDLEPLDGGRNGSSSHRHNDRLEREAEARRHGGSIISAATSSSSKKKHVKLYDAEDDAKRIASALNHSKPEGEVLSAVLPSLSHDQVLELRTAYKKQVKIQGKGVNLSKHIKTKVTGNFGKAAYITSLGRWESEGYWANFWYQSHGSRRELLIESLMGRTNAEIRAIKADFKDKRYGDSLTRCMEKELKMDKFRTAVLLALEERRQEEQDSYPTEYVHRDVELLHRAVRAEKGGESAMLEIVVRRSDAHLREVLKFYERLHGENFARAALRKSNNLVGEVIAHILNGVINKPARDALLLQHALRDIAAHNKDDELRYELLISRLVRIHWDKLHLMRVEKEYYEKYRVRLEDAIEDATKGDFRDFMMELCELRPHASTT